jgi:acetyltransferase-like isoleucine patch superfamily enzyme
VPGFVALHRLACRGYAKLFSLLARGSFEAFGSQSVIVPPARISGQRRIAIGSGVFIGSGSWLQVLAGSGDDVAINVGDGTSIVGDCVLSASRSVHVGRHVLMARNVYIADHGHAYADRRVPILEQGIADVTPVTIGDGAWLGQNVVVGPGVTIGRGAVIGANSVVKDDVPDYSVAVGAPARVVRDFSGDPRSEKPGFPAPILRPNA